MSLVDIAQGDNWTFKETIFEETKSYWLSETISLKDAAASSKRRQESAARANSEYKLTQDLFVTALGQTAMYLGLFGNYVDGSANRSQVIRFFGTYFSLFYSYNLYHLKWGSFSSCDLEVLLISFSCKQKRRSCHLSLGGREEQTMTKLPKRASLS